MPKAAISSASPLLIAKDVAAAVAFYRDLLDFEVTFQQPRDDPSYLYVPDPDALATEFSSRGVEFSEPLRDTEDNLRGFEIKDPDGYVLFFGRPI